MTVIRRSDDPERVFWVRDDLPTGRLILWRGNTRVGVREVEYVPASQLRGVVERITQLEAENLELRSELRRSFPRGRDGR